jgi:hypothetical protein
MLSRKSVGLSLGIVVQRVEPEGHSTEARLYIARQARKTSR